MAVGVTTMGLREARAAVEQLPRAVTLALRGVAWQSSRRIQEDAKRRLRAQTHGTGKTADAIVVIEEAEEQQFVIASQGDAGDAANLPLWLEFGTVKMSARPYMRPSALAESDRYRQEMAKASGDAARDVLQ